MWVLWALGHFLSVDMVDRTKCQGLFGMDQRCSWMFGPRVLQGYRSTAVTERNVRIAVIVLGTWN